MARIYLIAQRKAWHHELPDGWTELAWERFDYVECGVYEKSDADLTEVDKKWVQWHSHIPEGWVEPSGPNGQLIADPVADDSSKKPCFNLMVHMLEAYKVKIMNDVSENRVVMINDEPHTSIPVELALWLIQRAQLWERLEHDERVHQGNEV